MTARGPVVWVTNLPAPYRRPVWAALAGEGLRVVYLRGFAAERGWRVPDNVAFEQVALHDQASGGARARLTRPDIAAAIQDASAVVLGGWETLPYFQLLYAARRRGLPVVAFYESTLASHRFTSGPVAAARRLFFRQVDAVLTAGRASTEAVLGMGVPAPRIVTSFNAVDVAQFHDSATSRRDEGDGAHRYLYVGQFIDRKNVSAALSAFAAIRRDHDTLTLVGSGPLRPALEEQAQALDVGSAVRFLGQCVGDELLAAYAAADTLVLPSTEEVWGLVVNEALASGLHAVVSDRSGVAASTQHMRGVYVTGTDERSVAMAMSRSRDEWRGPVQNPEILSCTPERVADDARRAIRIARVHVMDPRAGVEVLWLTNIPTPYRAPLWRALAESARTHVVCLASTEENRHWPLPDTGDAGLTVLDVPRARAGSLTLYAPTVRLARLLRRARPHALVVDGWESPAFLFALLGARLRGVPTVASYRSTLASHRFKAGPVAAVRGWLFRSVGAVFTAGPASTEAVLAMGVPAGRIVTGFNAVDVAGIAAATAGRTVAAGHPVLYVGQLIDRKNVETALRGWARVRAPQDTFTVVGSGPSEHALRSLTARLRIAGHVRFTGHLDGGELVAEYAAAATLVLPSTEEVWGLVVNEALAAGCHVVVSSRAGIVPSVDRMRGVFVAAPTEAGLAAALERSRAAWSGPITDPEILAHTPERAADAVLRAVDVAKRRRG